MVYTFFFGEKWLKIKQNKFQNFWAIQVEFKRLDR